MVAVADSCYGSEDNYRFMDEAGIEVYFKCNRFYIEQRLRYRPFPSHSGNFHYNVDDGLPIGEHITIIGTAHSKTASGDRSENARYCAQNSKGCPLRCLCTTRPTATGGQS